MRQTKTLSLNLTLRQWQQDCIRDQTRYTVLACHRRSGKSHLGVYELSAAAFSVVGNYAFISPQKNQSKTNVWGVFKQILSNFIGVRADDRKEIVEFRETDLTIRFYNGSVIYLLGGEDPDKIRGAKLQGVVVDEVAQTPKELWSEVLRPALMDSHGWALFIGTPKGINLFSELYYRGKDPRFQPEWSAKKFTCYNTGALSPSEIESYKREVDDNTFRREMLCDFTASADDQLLVLDEVQAAMNRDYDERLFNMTLPLVMGVDVARMGADRSAISFRRGMIAEMPITLHQMPLTDLALVISKYYNERRPMCICVDGTGLGGGLVDMLIKLHLPVLDICFTAKATEQRFVNKRTEMWWNMAEWIRHGGVLPNDGTLLNELCAPIYETGEDGRIILEAKRKIKDRLGWSPDLADALALTFADKFDVPDVPDIVSGLREYGVDIKPETTTQMGRFRSRSRRPLRSSYYYRGNSVYTR